VSPGAASTGAGPGGGTVARDASRGGITRADPGKRYRGLLVDFGGVLTTDVFSSFRAFCDAEGLLPEAVRERFRDDPRGRELLFGLELGTIAEAEFEPRFAELLSVPAEGLIERLFAGMEPDEPMLGAVRAAKRAGVRTGMISNSWGAGGYDRDAFPELFCGWVISAEEGVRKPDPRIYALGAERVGLAPSECVFVDDLPGNLKPARELGMATVHHRGAAETIPELERLLGVELR
jgi:epoxide hydrolase-like predicted phosphatase